MAPGPTSLDVDRLIQAVREVKNQPSRIPILFQPDITEDEIRIYYNEPETFVRRKPAPG